MVILMAWVGAVVGILCCSEHLSAPLYSHDIDTREAHPPLTCTVSFRTGVDQAGGWVEMELYRQHPKSSPITTAATDGLTALEVDHNLVAASPSNRNAKVCFFGWRVNVPNQRAKSAFTIVS